MKTQALKGMRDLLPNEQTLRDSEKLLNDEFAHVLQIPQQDVPDYIRSRMEREA